MEQYSPGASTQQMEMMQMMSDELEQDVLVSVTSEYHAMMSEPCSLQLSECLWGKSYTSCRLLHFKPLGYIPFLCIGK